METLLKDLRYGARMLRRRPALTATAIASLALGIGALTAIFTVADAVVLRPLAYADADRLVVVWGDRPGRARDTVTPADFLDWRARASSFEELTAIGYTSLNISGGEYPERLRGAGVSRNFFATLGVAPALGRTFAADGAPDEVVISYGLWQRRFGGDRGIVGSVVRLDERPYTVAGVMPERFAWPVITPSSSLAGENVDFWIPAAAYDVPSLGASAPAGPPSRNASYLRVVGRLRPGVTIEQAGAEMAGVAAGLAAEHPETNADHGAKVASLHGQFVGDVRLPIDVLFAAGLLVIAIACTNVANLLLAHAAGRRQEMAVRAALGAGRWRLVRQLLVESVLLALVSGGAGVLVAVWGIPLLVRLSPGVLPRADEISVDSGALLFALVVSLATALVFGAVPALYGAKADVSAQLAAGGRSQSARGTWRGAFVVSGIALSLVLLVSAGLLLESFLKLRRVEPGFDGSRLLTFKLSLPEVKYATAERKRAFFEQALDRLGATPGVESAGAVLNVPLGRDDINFSILFEGRPAPPPADTPTVGFQIASPGYLRTMGIPVLEGRDLSPEDRADAPGVVVVSEATARRFWPGGGAVGSRVKLGGADGEWLTVVGVAGDVRHGGLDAAPRAEAYVPFEQQTFSFMDFVVRTHGDPRAAVPGVREAVAAVDPAQPIASVRTMDDLVADALADRRFTSLLVSLFGCAAILLSAVGVYGVVSYTVAQRSKEIGIRMALGAGRRDVLALVLGQGLKLALAGAAIGFVGALAATRALSSLLYGVSATDPLAFVAVATLVVAVALAASLVPARRASRLDPTEVLKSE
jgi:putative ABC transport system permease protein